MEIDELCFRYNVKHIGNKQDGPPRKFLLGQFPFNYTRNEDNT